MQFKGEYQREQFLPELGLQNYRQRQIIKLCQTQIIQFLHQIQDL
jgi:hypothetical protein